MVVVIGLAVFKLTDDTRASTGPSVVFVRSGKSDAWVIDLISMCEEGGGEKRKCRGREKDEQELPSYAQTLGCGL